MPVIEQVEEVKKINLLMIISLFHPFVGGAEKECQKLSKRLMEEGISVTVLTQHCDGLPEYEVIDGISVYRKIKGWHLFEISYMVSVLHFLFNNRKNFNVIQCFGLYLYIPPALIMKYLFGKKVIARLECAGHYGDFWRINQLRWRTFVMGSAKRLDNIITISTDIEEELVANNFPAKKLVHIANSVNVDQFKPSDNHTKDKPSKAICFVGRLEEQKGLDYLIRAMDIVREKEHAVKLFVVGDGQMKASLESLCEELQLQNRVFLVGATDDVLTYYQAADVFVLPSISEGLPLSLLEAMSCALPVVATLVGGNAEMVDSNCDVGEIAINDYHIGEHGILVNPRDTKGLAKALLRLLKDDALSQQLGSKARILVESKFSLDKIVKEYVELYSHLV